MGAGRDARYKVMINVLAGSYEEFVKRVIDVPTLLSSSARRFINRLRYSHAVLQRVERSTRFGRADCFEAESREIPRSVVADVLCANALISKRSAAGRAPLAGIATGGMTGVPLGVQVLPYCVRWGWLSDQNRRYQSESKRQR